MIDKRHIYDVTQSKTNHTCKNVLRNWTINWNLWLSHKLVKYPMTNLKRNWYVNWIKIECNHNGQLDIHYWTNFAKYDLENYETLYQTRGKRWNLTAISLIFLPLFAHMKDELCRIMICHIDFSMNHVPNVLM